MRHARLLGFVAASALALTAGAARAEDTVKIGFTTALTGPFNEFGEGVHRGVVLAMEKWNAAGGINGHKVELAELLDDQLIPDRSVQNLRRILDNKDIVAILAPSGSGPTLAVVDMVQADGRPMCNPQAQTPSIVYPNGLDKPPRPNVFSITIQNNVEAEKMADVLAKKFTKIGLLHESTGYGVTGAKLLKEEILKRNKNAKITQESYNQRDQDMTAQLVRMQRAGDEVLMVIGLGADMAVIRKNMSRLNMNIPRYGSAGTVTQPFIEGAGDLAEGQRAVNFLFASADPMRPATKEFADAYKAKYGVDRWWGPDASRPQASMAGTVASGYDCANLLFDAIRRANSTKPADIDKAMEATNKYPGAIIDQTFTPAKHNSVGPDDLVLYEFVKKDGRMQLVPTQE